MSNIFKSILCLLGIHNWKRYSKAVIAKNPFLYYRSERECAICKKKQFLTRTPLTNMKGSNKWITYE
jgi:hypothetical protein